MLLAIGAAAGCGEDSGLATVNGRVSFQGTPIEQGAVTFYPVEGRPVTATLGSDGAYECKLTPGDYRVTVAVSVQLPPGWKEGDPVPPQPITLPPKYDSRLKTPLTAAISADHSTPIDFALQ